MLDAVHGGGDGLLDGGQTVGVRRYQHSGGVSLLDLVQIHHAVP